MKITRELPVSGTIRTRKAFAFLPKWFKHGSNNNPLMTVIWLEHYLVEEHYGYGTWNFRGKRLNDTN